MHTIMRMRFSAVESPIRVFTGFFATFDFFRRYVVDPRVENALRQPQGIRPAAASAPGDDFPSGHRKTQNTENLK